MPVVEFEISRVSEADRRGFERNGLRAAICGAKLRLETPYNRLDFLTLEGCAGHLGHPPQQRVCKSRISGAAAEGDWIYSTYAFALESAARQMVELLNFFGSKRYNYARVRLKSFKIGCTAHLSTESGLGHVHEFAYLMAKIRFDKRVVSHAHSRDAVYFKRLPILTFSTSAFEKILGVSVAPSRLKMALEWHGHICTRQDSHNFQVRPAFWRVQSATLEDMCGDYLRYFGGLGPCESLKNPVQLGFKIRTTPNFERALERFLQLRDFSRIHYSYMQQQAALARERIGAISLKNSPSSLKNCIPFQIWPGVLQNAISNYRDRARPFKFYGIAHRASGKTARNWHKTACFGALSKYFEISAIQEILAGLNGMGCSLYSIPDGRDCYEIRHSGGKCGAIIRRNATRDVATIAWIDLQSISRELARPRISKDCDISKRV